MITFSAYSRKPFAHFDEEDTVYRLSWVLYIVGTILVAGSWFGAVSVQVGWCGWIIAMIGWAVGRFGPRAS